MTDDQELGRAALRFVDQLTPGNFAAAAGWLSRDCVYAYGDSLLRGEAIVQSFVDNHERAARGLDRIEYQDGAIEAVDGRTVSVVVTDRIWVGERTHDYRDRLVVTFGERPGPGSVIRIENKRIAGERERLLRFFEECGMAWE